MLPVLRYETLDSTNLEARRLWEKGRAPREGFYVAAQAQTAGRGRMGRKWVSPRGGLWFTLAAPIPEDPRRFQGVSLAAGLAAAEGVEEAAGIRCSVKWPNDLLAGRRKFCGILCEMVLGPPGSLLLVGIGIDANFEVSLLGGNLLHPATTLLEITGKETDLEDLLEKVGTRLEAALAEMRASGLEPFLSPLRERLAYLGEEVEILLPGGEIRKGLFQGVDSRGRALLRTARGLEAHLTGDLRPAY